MKCPVDGRELLLTHREGIELDYCPECRGIWFDRGELDKVIERTNLQLDAASVPRDQGDRGDRRDRDDRDDRRDRDDREKYEKYEKYGKYEKTKKKKATSFLSDLLEFG
jgi:Zn-finger nucleic acid-binding protein